MKLAWIVAAFAIVLAPQVASAQSAATTALDTCITRATTEQDSVVLMRWMFFAMARHPSVAQYANVPDAQRVESNRAMGALVNRLLLEACPNETRAAFQADGQAAIEAAFGSFGKRAMADLMDHPDVNAAIVEMSAYLDQTRLTTLLQQQH